MEMYRPALRPRRSSQTFVKGKKVWLPLSWTARRRGDLYCSPACGADCSREAYEAAKATAAALAKTLGRGWRPVVWENIGWFAKAVSPCGHVSVYAPDGHRGKAYSAFLNAEAGKLGGRWTADSRSPRAASLLSPYLDPYPRLC